MALLLTKIVLIVLAFLALLAVVGRNVGSTELLVWLVLLIGTVTLVVRHHVRARMQPIDR